jgi:type I restriction enzyme S subunit
MCSRNGSARLVGKTATIKNLNEEMTFGTFMMIIRSQYNPYLSWFFKSTDFRNQIKGGENTMINQITRYMLDDIVLSFPPIDKQNEIVQKLDALSFEIKKLDAIYNQKINDLEELKKSVLQKAFSGELRSPEGAASANDGHRPSKKSKSPERA